MKRRRVLWKRSSKCDARRKEKNEKLRLHCYYETDVENNETAVFGSMRLRKQTGIVKNMTGCQNSVRVSVITRIRRGAIVRESANENVIESANTNVR